MAGKGISVNYRDNNQYRFYSSSVVLSPWLEGTIRYLMLLLQIQQRRGFQWRSKLQG
ncbi:hypothetical protein ACVXG7_12660 [Enterobacter hormaechei]